MPYRAKEAIDTDVNPTTEPFTGQLLAEGDAKAGFILIGKGGILSDADAERYGLIGDARIEQIEEGQALRENDERNRATHGASARAMAGASVEVETPPPPVTQIASVNATTSAPAQPAAPVAPTPATQTQSKPPAAVKATGAPAKAGRTTARRGK